MNREETLYKISCTYNTIAEVGLQLSRVAPSLIKSPELGEQASDEVLEKHLNELHAAAVKLREVWFEIVKPIGGVQICPTKLIRP